MAAFRGAAFHPALLLLLVCIARAQAGGAKQVCPEECEQLCDQQGACLDSCPGGTVQVGRVCVRCADPLCLECGPTPATCKACARFVSEARPGFNSDEDTDFPVFRAPNGRCTKCANFPKGSGCTACGPWGGCRACESGFALQPNGRCGRCGGGPECDTCDPRTLQCTKCNGGYGLNAMKTCVPCAAQDCRQCDNFRICTDCYTGLYVTAGNQCAELPDNCADANPRGQCIECDEGYTVVGGKCVRCGAGCDKCSSPGVCVECSTGHAKSPQNRCLSCGDGCVNCAYKGPGQAVCTECNGLSLIGGRCRRCDDPRCEECRADGRCRQCINPDHVVNPATGRCQDPAWGTPPQATRPGPTPAIINGTDAPRGRYPYITSLRSQESKFSFTHFCGGAALNERVVLTAAHCLISSQHKTFNAWNRKNVWSQVRLGGIYESGGLYEKRNVKWALVHPNYAASGNTFDVALLLLDKPTTMRPLLRLPSGRRPAPGTMLRVAGWGYIDQNNTAPISLQQADIKLLPDATCASYLPKERWDVQFCAGEVAKHIDSCQGDSGGPVVIPGATAAQDVLAGVVSWGIGCAGATPGVYADVAAMLPWINTGVQFLLREEAAGRFPTPPADDDSAW